MENKIKEVLEGKVNPILAEHYGGAVLSSFENNIAWIKMTGACGQCPSALITIEEVVKDMIISNVKGVEDVRLDTSVSEDLLSMARKILNKKT